MPFGGAWCSTFHSKQMTCRHSPGRRKAAAVPVRATLGMCEYTRSIGSTSLPLPSPPPLFYLASLRSPLRPWVPSDTLATRRLSCDDCPKNKKAHLGGIRRPSPARSPSLASSASSSWPPSPAPPPPSPSFPPLLLARTAAAAASEMSSPPPAPAGFSSIKAAAVAEPPLEPALASGRGVSGFGTAGRSCLRTRSGDSIVDDVTCGRRRRGRHNAEREHGEVDFKRLVYVPLAPNDASTYFHAFRGVDVTDCKDCTQSTGNAELNRQDEAMCGGGGWVAPERPRPLLEDTVYLRRRHSFQFSRYDSSYNYLTGMPLSVCAYSQFSEPHILTRRDFFTGCLFLYLTKDISCASRGNGINCVKPPRPVRTSTEPYSIR